MKIFISHSHADQEAATALVNFLLSGLHLEDTDIRCTSAPGHQLRFGTTISQILKNDINLTTFVIGLISINSQKADWVPFELGAAWGLGKAILPILSPDIEPRYLPGPLGNLPYITINTNDAPSRMMDLLQQLHEELGAPLKTGGKTQSNLTAFISSYTQSPQQNANTKSPATTEQTILLTIWKLTETNYDQHGYSLEAISQHANQSIPMCEHHLENLVKKSFVEKKSYIGGINGLRYLLKQGGRDQLISNELVK